MGNISQCYYITLTQKIDSCEVSSPMSAILILRFHDIEPFALQGVHNY
jgi:hypothetical protein